MEAAQELLRNSSHELTTRWKQCADYFVPSSWSESLRDGLQWDPKRIALVPPTTSSTQPRRGIRRKLTWEDTINVSRCCTAIYLPYQNHPHKVHAPVSLFGIHAPSVLDWPSRQGGVCRNMWYCTSWPAPLAIGQRTGLPLPCLRASSPIRSSQLGGGPPARRPLPGLGCSLQKSEPARSSSSQARSGASAARVSPPSPGSPPRSSAQPAAPTRRTRLWCTRWLRRRRRRRWRRERERRRDAMRRAMARAPTRPLCLQAVGTPPPLISALISAIGWAAAAGGVGGAGGGSRRRRQEEVPPPFPIPSLRRPLRLPWCVTQ